MEQESREQWIERHMREYLDAMPGQGTDPVTGKLHPFWILKGLQVVDVITIDEMQVGGKAWKIALKLIPEFES